MKKTVRSLIDSKKPFIGTFMQFPSVELTEMFAYTGFDFLIMDMEHGLIDHKDALEMVRACELHDTAAMIRVPNVDEEKIKKALDMGASGILVAGVHSYEDAVNAVKFAKFKPMGGHGTGIGGSRTDGCSDCAGGNSQCEKNSERSWKTLCFLF